MKNKILVIALAFMLAGCGKEADTTLQKADLELEKLAAEADIPDTSDNKETDGVSSMEEIESALDEDKSEASSEEQDADEEALSPDVEESQNDVDVQPAEEESKEENTDNVEAVESTQEQPEQEQQVQPRIQESTAWVDTSSHSYYKGLTAEQASQADEVAQQIASSIISCGYSSDLERVNAAAEAVASYCASDTYGVDDNGYYCSPYGVFVAGIFTCAGSTRALGRVLDYLGYSWQHINENQWSHQWCVLTLDGQAGFADGMGGFAGYGSMENGMTLSDGSTIFFAE